MSRSDDKFFELEAERDRLKAINAELLAAHERIKALSAGWDGEGSTGPKEPYRWETIARLSMDISFAAIANATKQGGAA